MSETENDRRGKLSAAYQEASSQQRTIGNLTVEIFNPSEKDLDRIGEKYVSRIERSTERYVNDLEKTMMDYKFLPLTGREKGPDLSDEARQKMLDTVRKLSLEKMLSDHAAKNGRNQPVLYLLGGDALDTATLHSEKFKTEMEEFARQQGINDPIRIVGLGNTANEVWKRGIMAETGMNPGDTMAFLFTARGQVVGQALLPNPNGQDEATNYFRQSFAQYKGTHFTGPPPDVTGQPPAPGLDPSAQPSAAPMPQEPLRTPSASIPRP